jgi:hypothetical protein
LVFTKLNFGENTKKTGLEMSYFGQRNL